MFSSISWAPPCWIFLAVRFRWPRGGFPAYLSLVTHNFDIKMSSDNNFHIPIKNSEFGSPGNCRNVASKLVNVSSSEKSTCPVAHAHSLLYMHVSDTCLRHAVDQIHSRLQIVPLNTFFYAVICRTLTH